MSATDFEYADSAELLHHAYMLPAILRILSNYPTLEKRAFEIGCGSGYVANFLNRRGFVTTGIDPSRSGIETANKHFPHLSLFIGNSDENLPEKFGTFPFVYSLETISHVVKPEIFAQRVYDLLTDDGVAFVSTPYHGYWKNLALSLLDRWDRHLHTLEETRYLSLYSEATFSQLWRNAGFRSVKIVRVGRTKAFAKAMIAVLQKHA
jgi:2-polyprenyl-6-hydroxyphenyl methylase/3-demethylubiquinone-9 3-methyltransferase